MRRANEHEIYKLTRTRNEIWSRTLTCFEPPVYIIHLDEFFQSLQIRILSGVYRYVLIYLYFDIRNKYLYSIVNL